ncbi:MAG: Dockerin type I repeat protein [Pelotomaculum sp. PtaB.Bin104]|nr:MAG: Dockerin type I repeat protein [Pelotomaculum sp. PtaB.Bin104]
MKLKKSPVILLLTLIMVLQGVVLGLTAFAGTNLPNVISYGVYSFDPNSNVETTTVAQGTVVSTGNTGAIYNEPPWPTLTGVPCSFSGNVGIGIKFATNVVPEAYWTANQACFHMYDASNNSVAINVIRIGTVYDGNNGNRNYIFIIPQCQLQPGSTYEIVIDSTLTSNNTQQAGKEQRVYFTTNALQGDMNDDNTVNIQDLLWMTQYMGEALTGESLRADFNKDGVVNILDLLKVKALLT